MIARPFTLAAAAVAAFAAPAPLLAADCSGAARAPWASAGGGYALAAAAKGPACAVAAVSLAIVGPGGKVLHRYAATGDQNFMFKEVRTKGDMAAALAEWLKQAGRMPTAADLPDWKAGDAGPWVGQEFPFYPEDGLSRADYLALRQAKRPMVCYVQGMESLGCVVLRADGTVQKVGVQSFPG